MPTTNELEGRIFVLESLCMTALGIIFATTGASDPDHKRALTTLSQIKSIAEQKLTMGASPEARKEGLNYLDHLLSEISENLDSLRRN